MTLVGPTLCIPIPLNHNRIMAPIVVFVNLMPVIEVIPKDLMVVGLFGHCSLACIKEQAIDNYTNPLGCLVRCFRNYELGLGVTKLIKISKTKHS